MYIGKKFILIQRDCVGSCISNHFYLDPSISQMTDHAPAPPKLDFSPQTPGVRASESPMALQWGVLNREKRQNLIPSD